jgi:hypothetical protein
MKDDSLFYFKITGTAISHTIPMFMYKQSRSLFQVIFKLTPVLLAYSELKVTYIYTYAI